MGILMEGDEWKASFFTVSFFCCCDAKREGITLITQAIPLAIESIDEKSAKLVWGEAEMVAEEGKRPRPVLIEGSRNEVTATSVIAAIGQEADYSFLPQEFVDRLTFKSGAVVTDENMQTADPKIFAGGDIRNRTRDAISAIADGHRAAKGIDLFLGQSTSNTSTDACSCTIGTFSGCCVLMSSLLSPYTSTLKSRRSTGEPTSWRLFFREKYWRTGKPKRILIERQSEEADDATVQTVAKESVTVKVTP